MALLAKFAPRRPYHRTVTARVTVPIAGNMNSNGLFAPVVRTTRDIVGVKRFNAFRGKAIALHSQVIGDFCTEFGIDTKMKQSLIRRAKANGGKLGFLA